MPKFKKKDAAIDAFQWLGIPAEIEDWAKPHITLDIKVGTTYPFSRWFELTINGVLVPETNWVVNLSKSKVAIFTNGLFLNNYEPVVVFKKKKRPNGNLKKDNDRTALNLDRKKRFW